MGFDEVLTGDCLEVLANQPAGCADLVFADPPFNIGYEYDVYDDRRAKADYLAWTEKWLAAVARVLKPTGSFFLAIGDEFAAEHKVRLDALGLTLRNWIVWHYTFGVNCTKKFNRSHAHIFYYVRDPKSYTFNPDAVRVPSARQTTYADRRANPVGKLPDDTWVLRPQESEDHFRANRTRGSCRECAARSRSGEPPVPDAGGACWSGSSAWRRTPATWCSTRSPAAARRWRSRRSSAADTSVWNCRMSTPTAFASACSRSSSPTQKRPGPPQADARN